jgi:LPXTG-site transpeptidase (sortase) family protein
MGLRTERPSPQDTGPFDKPTAASMASTPLLPTLSPRPEAETPTTTVSPTSTPTSTEDPFAILTALAQSPTVAASPLTPPARLLIPAIDLDFPVVPVGLDREGNGVVLKHDVAWYRGSGRPGEGTNIVMWAHVLRWKDSPQIPAPFARVHELRQGDHITLVTGSGNRREYVVTYQIRTTPERVDYMAPTQFERLVLISCIGEKVIVRGEITKAERLITIAEPFH